MKRLTILSLIIILSISAFSQDIKGSWSGVLNTGVGKIPLVVNISEKEGGGYSATMDSPSQGAKGIPVSAINIIDAKLTFSIANLRIEYEGVWQTDSIAGMFKQNGVTLPLTLSPAKKDEFLMKRPQSPLPPYPYNSEDVRFENNAAGITLAGTLTLPKEGKNFPVAVLVTGSGPQNRNEEILGHKPFLVLSDYLTRNGIAVLRYDDRGVAESSGSYSTATLEDFATDAAAAVNYLKTRKEINPEKMGIIGHSEGGTIAFMLASEKNNHLAYIVSMAGMAIPGDSLLKMQRYLISSKMGISEELIAKNETYIEIASGIINKYPSDSILQNPDKFITESLPDSLGAIITIKTAVKQLMAPEIKSILNYNPADVLKMIKCPVLALNGEIDLQVPADINLDRIKTLVKSPVIVKKYTGLNHLFQHCTTGLPNEYGSIEETISPEVLSDIAAWIKQAVK